MRPADVFLTVLFPILIAVGLALGMDSTSSLEFSLARGALWLAAAIPVILAFLTFRESDLSFTSVSVLCVTVAIIAGSLVIGLKWLDLKENIYCVVVPSWAVGDSGPYKLYIFNPGIFPAVNVRVYVREIHEPYDLQYVDIGDVEPESVVHLEKFRPIATGTYQIDLRMRSGKFQELLSFERSGETLPIHYILYRLAINDNTATKTVIKRQ